MNSRLPKRPVVLLGAGLLLRVSLAAEIPTNEILSAGSNYAHLHAPASLTPQTPPPLPKVESPVDFFRKLLAMHGTERQAALAGRSPESQKIILAKVREYVSLDPDERELRLQVTELRWYLWPLMNLPATNRPAQLAGIPAAFRPLVESRLQKWDRLPAEVRKELLDNEATIRYFTEIEGRTPEQRRKTLEALSSDRRQKLQEGIDQWSKLSEGQRRILAEHFNQFFELTPPEREKALRTLSAPERRQLETTLKSFGQLPAADRAKCIRSFEKFASMDMVQRQQFLRNAERWKQMTPNERQAWRELVDKVPPPLPADLPPLPLTTRSTVPTHGIATNGD